MLVLGATEGQPPFLHPVSCGSSVNTSRCDQPRALGCCPTGLLNENGTKNLQGILCFVPSSTFCSVRVSQRSLLALFEVHSMRETHMPFDLCWVSDPQGFRSVLEWPSGFSSCSNQILSSVTHFGEPQNLRFDFLCQSLMYIALEDSVTGWMFFRFQCFDHN